LARFAAPSPRAVPPVPEFGSLLLPPGVPRPVLRRGAAGAHVSRPGERIRGLLAPVHYDPWVGCALLPAGPASGVGPVRAAARFEPIGSGQQPSFMTQPPLPPHTKYWTRPEERQRAVNRMFDRSASDYDDA